MVGFLVVIITLVIFLVLVAASVLTLVIAARSASEGFEDEIGFHRVKAPRSTMAEDPGKPV
ncbi:MAG: hypothetical protein ABIQ12_08740 [Opitutaceae bacterium]